MDRIGMREVGGSELLEACGGMVWRRPHRLFIDDQPFPLDGHIIADCVTDIPLE